jgi:hypothetical protein
MAMRRGGIPIISAMTAALTLGAVSMAQAQQQQRSPQTQTQRPAVSDKEIHAFADAAKEVQQLNQKWYPRVQAAAQQGPDAENKARQQARAELTAAVQKKGLSVERYHSILELAQTDPEVQRKIQQRMQPSQ